MTGTAALSVEELTRRLEAAYRDGDMLAWQRALAELLRLEASIAGRPADDPAEH